MFELKEIFKAYIDAKTWIEQADVRIKELENKFGNEKVIKSVYDHNKLMVLIASNLANFFENIFSEGEGKFNPVASKDLIKDLIQKMEKSKN